MKENPPQIVLCNGADLPKQWEQSNYLSLEYRDIAIANQNVKLALRDFVRDVYYLPDRILDLLEIAAYVYCADRLKSRGHKTVLEPHSWARTFYFFIKVRDYEFWENPDVKERLKNALVYMTGDQAYHFSFQHGHSTPREDLFDKEVFQIESNENTKVILFSGGLDSLSGVVECLKNPSDPLCLISHRSGPGRMTKTRKQLIQELRKRYPNRINYYEFACSLKGVRANEETQRTRTFLFTSIAYTLSYALSLQNFAVYENGITSLNFPTQQYLMNSRASRTTHPKTVALLQNFFNSLSETNQQNIIIHTPFFEKTKADIFRTIAETGNQNLISSTVSCSKTFQYRDITTHCGGCSQCIDRRFAAYASEMDDIDESGIYAFDFIQEGIDTDEVRTMLFDYFRRAKNYAEWNLGSFSRKMFNHLVNILDYVPGANDDEKVKKIWQLCQKHGQEVEVASRKMREIHDDNLYRKLPDSSFLKVIAERRYLNDSSQQEQLSKTNSLNSQENGFEMFYAYSHADEELRDQFENHLSILKWQRVIKNWHDRRISAGAEWEGQIDEHLNSAHIILLLISSDFISSSYCYNVEMRRALERHEANEAIVIPIILRPVYWKNAPFAKLNALPTNGKAVTSWDNQDEAFLDIVEGISKVVDELKKTLSNNDD